MAVGKHYNFPDSIPYLGQESAHKMISFKKGRELRVEQELRNIINLSFFWVKLSRWKYILKEKMALNLAYF